MRKHALVWVAIHVDPYPKKWLTMIGGMGRVKASKGPAPVGGLLCNLGPSGTIIYHLPAVGRRAWRGLKTGRSNNCS